MIHLAPCDCELHVRIRGLEAELDGHQDDVGGSVRQCQVRIANAEKWLRECQTSLEKAEGQVNHWKNKCIDAELSVQAYAVAGRAAVARAEKAEADMAAAQQYRDGAIRQLTEVLGIRRVLEARVAELEAIVEENGLGVKPLSQRGSREAE